MKCATITGKVKERTKQGSNTRLESFLGFGSLLGENYLVPIEYNKEYFDFLNSCDVVFIEWPWYLTWQDMIFKWYKYGKKSKLVVFTGSIQRWWQNIDANTIDKHFEAIKMVDIIGCYNRDTISYYKSVFKKPVIHMPIPIFLDNMNAFIVPIEKRDKRKITLTVHTGFYQIPHARRGDPINLLIFRELKEKFPDLKGITFLDGHCKEKEEETKYIIKNVFHIDDLTLLPVMREYKEYIKDSWLALQLQFLGDVQGHWSQTHAKLQIPIISSSNIETHRYLFPKLHFRYEEWDKVVDKINFLLSDNGMEEYRKIIDTASSRIKYYSSVKCKDRIIKALREL